MKGLARFILFGCLLGTVYGECVRVTVVMPCTQDDLKGLACTLVGAACSSWFSQGDTFGYQRFMSHIFDVSERDIVDLSEGAIYTITPQSILHGLNYKVQRLTPQRLRELCGWSQLDGEDEFTNAFSDEMDVRTAQKINSFYVENSPDDISPETSLLYIRSIFFTGFHVPRGTQTVSLVPELWTELFRERHNLEHRLLYGQ